VVEKNKKKDDTKQEEEKPIDYLSRQGILFGATERVAKVEWWISLIVYIVLILVGSLGPLLFLSYFLAPAEAREDHLLVISFFLSLFFLAGLSGVFALLSGRKEYERFKRKRES
jgi:hypothetical protein